MTHCPLIPRSKGAQQLLTGQPFARPAVSQERRQIDRGQTLIANGSGDILSAQPPVSAAASLGRKKVISDTAPPTIRGWY